MKKLPIHTIVTPSVTPSPTPTPYPLPQGKQAFQFSYGKRASGPKIGQVSIDPFDPKPGKKQTYTISVSHTKPIVSIVLSLHTDHTVQSYALKRTDGTDTQGTWQTVIDTQDTHAYTYYAYFIAKSAEDEFRGGLTLRAY